MGAKQGMSGARSMHVRRNINRPSAYRPGARHLYFVYCYAWRRKNDESCCSQDRASMGVVNIHGLQYAAGSTDHGNGRGVEPAVITVKPSGRHQSHWRPIGGRATNRQGSKSSDWPRFLKQPLPQWCRPGPVTDKILQPATGSDWTIAGGFDQAQYTSKQAAWDR